MKSPTLCGAVISFAAFVATTTSLDSAEPQPEKPAAEAKPKITISKETTYITEPLRLDGYPDYVAAVDSRMRAGVTPENNAAVLLQKAFGPQEIPTERRAKYFERLGIEPLPDEGDYFIGQGEMVKRWQSDPHDALLDKEELAEQFYRAAERPWAAKDFPMVAEWLRLNEAPLQLVLEASRRPKCYFPVLADDDGLLIAALLPHGSQSREVAVALVARAMLRTEQGKIADAWTDLLSCHCLARQICQGFSLVEFLFGIALDRIAALGDAELAHFGNLSAKQAAKMQQDLSALPVFAEIFQVIAEGERMSYLSSVTAVSRGGPRTLKDLIRQGDKRLAITDFLDEKSIDWDVVLKIGNEWYDRFETAAKIAEVRQRRSAMAKVGEEFEEMTKKLGDHRALFNDLIINRTNKEIVSSKIGRLLAFILVPAMSGVVNARDRCVLQNEMVQTAFALSAYRSDNGAYPDKLEQLVPKYLAPVPDDMFKPTPGPIGYRRDGDAYLLWSVFLNGIDENGSTSEDDPPGDDWVLHPVPAAKK